MRVGPTHLGRCDRQALRLIEGQVPIDNARLG
jgi:hypothetical protein